MLNSIIYIIILYIIIKYINELYKLSLFKNNWLIISIILHINTLKLNKYNILYNY